MTNLVESAYRRLGACSRLLFGATLVAIALGVFALAGLKLDSDVALLLPDGSGEAATQFELLRSAPFASTLVIHVYSDEAPLDELIAASDKLADTLDLALFSKVISGAEGGFGERVVDFLLTYLPRLLTEEDLSELEKRTGDEEVTRAVDRAFMTLVSPGGSALKGHLQRDPLGLLELAGAKLKYLKLIGEGDFDNGRFVGPSGKSILLFAETPVEITDAEGAARLEAEFDRALGQVVASVDSSVVSGASIKADLIGAHRYSSANASTIKSDLTKILTASSIGVLAFFFLWLRGPGALAVWLLPLGGLVIAAALTSFVHGGLSGITLGFGGVLLGISVDYGLHVYYACKTKGGDETGRALGIVSRPVVFAALTTLAGFAVLFTSRLPGQRQLALFAVIGVALCLLGALFILPHLIGAGRGRAPGGPKLALTAGGSAGKVVVALWCVWLLAAAWLGTGVRFGGELKKLGMRPAELVAAEQKLEQEWGAVQSRSFAWAEGATTDEALARADEALKRYQAKAASGSNTGKVVALTPLLPPLKVQGENLARWEKFWNPERIASVRNFIEGSAKAKGFTSGAFDPFFAFLAVKPPPIRVAKLRSVGLGEVVDALLVEGEAATGTASAALLLAPDDGSLNDALGDPLNEEVQGVSVVSPRNLSRLLGESIKSDFIRFIALALVAVTLMVAFLLRRPALVVAALAPVAAGLISLFGVAGLMGWEFDLFNIVASILTVGLGVDYGIFMAVREKPQDLAEPAAIPVEAAASSGSTETAVLVSGLTTLAGVGSLVLATHPSLHSIGVTVLVGVGAAMLTALWVTPTLAALAGGGSR